MITNIIEFYRAALNIYYKDLHKGNIVLKSMEIELLNTNGLCHKSEYII